MRVSLLLLCCLAVTEARQKSNLAAKRHAVQDHVALQVDDARLNRPRHPPIEDVAIIKPRRVAEFIAAEQSSNSSGVASTPPVVNSTNSSNTTNNTNTTKPPSKPSRAVEAFPVNINTDDLSLVINGSCQMSCRPATAMLLDRFQWGSAQAHGPLQYKMTLTSMMPNTLATEDISWHSPGASDDNSTSHTSYIPRITSMSTSQVIVEKICRQTGIAIIHVAISHPAAAYVPSHFFLKTVCDVEVPEACDSITKCGLHGVCAGHMDLTKVTCNCEKDYSGLDCSVGLFDQCPGKCSGHGVSCSDAGECECLPGFGGEKCDYPTGCAHLSMCSGHGSCIDDEVCACDAGWADTTCKTESASDRVCAGLSYCKGRGKCVKVQGYYGCECDVGFVGSDCGMVNSTCPGSCSGHGTCVAGVCECQLGFTGDDCGQAFSPCHGCMNGECVESVTTGVPTCVCDAMWSGPHCTIYDHSKDPCKFKGFCSGQGVCADSGECACASGLGGDTCNTVSPDGCVSSCGGFGTCELLTDACACDSSHGGVDCKTALCPTSDSKTCGAHGVCQQNDAGVHECECKAPFFGSACQNAVCNANTTCSGHGTCLKNSGVANLLCNCTAGWEGPSCSTELTSALSLIKHEKKHDIYEDSEWDNDVL